MSTISGSVPASQAYRRSDWDHTARTRVVADVMLGQMEQAPDAASRQEIHGRLSRYLGGFQADEVDARSINVRLAAMGLPLVDGGSSEGKRPLGDMPVEMKQGIQRFNSLGASGEKQGAVLAHIADLTGGSLTETEFAQAKSLLQLAARSR